MTLKELLAETYTLGFESVGEMDDTFIFCTQRALRIIHSALPEERLAEIFVKNPQYSYSLDEYRHSPGTELDVSVSGTAVSFVYSGTGELIIMDTKTAKSITFSGIGSVREFLNGASKLIFRGDLIFDITDLRVYTASFGKDKSDIPLFSKFTEYDLDSMIPDLMAVCALPFCDTGEVVGAQISGHVLRIQSEFEGRIYIRYRRLPSMPSKDDTDSRIDIPAYAEHLLPILTAAYLWLDDDADKAEYYMSIYKSEMRDILSGIRARIENGYRDVTGWAK